jgi:hypothetical protein
MLRSRAGVAGCIADLKKGRLIGGRWWKISIDTTLSLPKLFYVHRGVQAAWLCARTDPPC